MIAATALSFTGCKSSQTTYTPLKETDNTIYHISICSSYDNDYYNAIELGFTDALHDTFGEKHLDVETKKVTPEENADTICTSFINGDSQLIFANGESSLAAASLATDKIPIVGAGVYDFKSTLHLLTGDDEWDYTTKTNVTGVSSMPSIASQLSELIEATPDMQTVGILYSPEDEDAIYQNEFLEDYLDQAGVPWKEYEIPSTETTNALTGASTENRQADYSSVITSVNPVASSSKAGADMDVISLGENDYITGINSEKAIRSSKISNFWYGPKGTAKPDFATFDWSSLNKDSFKSNLPENASCEEVVSYACNECSALYLSSGSILDDQSAAISEIATNDGVSTFGGDTISGANTLVSLYADPYELGYRAGKLAYRILINEEDPGSIKIQSADNSGTKLYQDTIASRLNITFPKSFEEFDSFISTYQIGSTTTRITSSPSDNSAE